MDKIDLMKELINLYQQFIYMRDQAECGLETTKIVRDTLEHMITRRKEK